MVGLLHRIKIATGSVRLGDMLVPRSVFRVSMFVVRPSGCEDTVNVCVCAESVPDVGVQLDWAQLCLFLKCGARHCAV